MNCRTCGAVNDPSAYTCRVCGKDPATEPGPLPVSTSGAVSPPSVLTVPPETQQDDTGPAIAWQATATLISGAIGWIVVAFGAMSFSAGSGTPWIVPLPVFIALGTVIAGHHARKLIAESNGELIGLPFASLGLVLGYLLLIPGGLLLLGLCVYVSVSAGLQRMLE